MALSAAHTTAKAADVARLLLLNKGPVSHAGYDGDPPNFIRNPTLILTLT